MPDTGYDQSAIAHQTYNVGNDIDGVLVNDGAELTSDAVSLDMLVTRVYSVIGVEDNTGACDGNLYVSALASDLDPDGEGYQVGPTTGPVHTDPVVTGCVLDIAQNTTRRGQFAVSGAQCPRHKVHVLNDCGQQIAVTVNYVDTDVPAAS